MTIEETDPAAPEAAALIAELDTELLKRYPGMTIQGLEEAGFRARGGVFLLGRVDGVAVACGAMRPLEEGACEVKRMFVLPHRRGEGWGKAILAALEDAARRRGYRMLRLETGERQPEAIRLYAKAGFTRVHCNGEEGARCFEKRLA